MRGYFVHTWEAWLAMLIFIALGFMIDERLMIPMWIVASVIFLGALKLTYEYIDEGMEINEWNETQTYNRDYEAKTGGYTQSFKNEKEEKEAGQKKDKDDFETVTKRKKEEILRKMKEQNGEIIFKIND